MHRRCGLTCSSQGTSSFQKRSGSGTDGQREALKDFVVESHWTFLVLSVAAPFTRGSRPTKFGQSVEVEIFYLPVGEGLNVDADVVIKGNLIFNVKIDSDICDRLVVFYVALSGKDSAIHVDNKDDFASI